MVEEAPLAVVALTFGVIVMTVPFVALDVWGCVVPPYPLEGVVLAEEAPLAVVLLTVGVIVLTVPFVALGVGDCVVPP
jgi:hypothetical protein